MFVFKLKLRLKQLRIAGLLVFFRCLSIFVKNKPWIICERGTEARDNGYSFYKYMKENHPEKKVYFLITKDSADFHKVREDALIFDSIRHYWAAACAERIVSAHYASVLPVPVATKIFFLLKMYKNFCFLQHGITKDDQKVLYANSAPMRLFICGAKPEFDDISKRYGHPEGVVKYTGFARFDSLHDVKTENQILVMPTWREHITSESEFLASDYFKKWQSILADEGLNRLLKEKEMKMYFYVHYEMQKYALHFKAGSENIVIARFNDYDVQALLKESRLLITDYSSVFFDFAYMKKPMVFYQFDKYHYAKGYFDYRRDGFGRVCTEHGQVIDEIQALAENDFCMEDEYGQRVESFFPLRDTRNSERIYQAILDA